MTIILLALFGIVGIIFGIVSLSWGKALGNSEFVPKNWKRLRAIALIIGLLIGVASWPATYFMGYPYSGEKETGRVVGIPMMVGYFDSEGRDYVGPFTMPAVVGNAIFWFFTPHLILVVHQKYKIQKLNKANSNM